MIEIMKVFKMSNELSLQEERLSLIVCHSQDKVYMFNEPMTF